MKKIILSIFAVVVLTPILLIGGYIGLIYNGNVIHFHPYQEKIDFNQEQWIQNANVLQRPYYRLMMVDKLLKKERRFRNKSRNYVTKTLGPATQTDYFSNFDLVYYLGPQRGPGIDSEWLCFKLDESGIVQKCIIMVD